ncbi:DUF3298 and DUF4163 domain-containing protein [Clostridium ljungdahlii]|uniref:DUF3298 domain-containing protein n=1 Tax=Clostridium ljungdahlii TaxID=1538 RepID=A0A166R0T7_9CLOT|nr:DUF3298 and DUF4163 domain-containing protein [Clostridium ljungdahlii]OAA90553.1 hypothetical protein WY13_01457 [Clostridium ljungdahlii]
MPHNHNISKNICPFAKHFFRTESSSGIMLNTAKISPEKFSISYPFIANPNKDQIINKINTSIINEVSKLFTSQVLFPERIDFNEILGTYDVMLNKNGLLSILFNMYTYVNKAAHGFTAYSSITLNVNTGQIYNFNDLFNPKIYYVGFLNELAKQYIKNNNITLINEYKGITPDQQYYLTPNSLVLYYQVYEYTPYYYGIFEIELPYSKIKNLLSPTSPINALIS